MQQMIDWQWLKFATTAGRAVCYMHPLMQHAYTNCLVKNLPNDNEKRLHNTLWKKTAIFCNYECLQNRSVQLEQCFFKWPVTPSEARFCNSWSRLTSVAETPSKDRSPFDKYIVFPVKLFCFHQILHCGLVTRCIRVSNVNANQQNFEP